MTRQRPEVADVFREHANTCLATYGATTAQRRVLRAVENYRTAALGGHVEACDHCDHRRIAYNSCRNRHCPKCQGAACARWMQARAAELLPRAVLPPCIHPARGAVAFSFAESKTPL